MKLEVQANDFCPDDCPMVDIEKIVIANIDEARKRRTIFRYICKNAKLCENLHRCYEEKKK